MSVDMQEIEAREDHSTSGVCVQDNALVRSAYTMTLLEKRLLMLAISKVSAGTPPQSGQPIKVTVHVDEWRELYREKDPWSDLARAADRLMGRIVIMHPKEKGVRRKKMNWTDSVVYHDSKVVIKFGHSLSIELAGMLDNFTQTKLLDVAKLDSFYAIRLHELLMQFTTTGCLMITVEDLRDIMNVSDKYPRFSQFNQRVIKVAVEEIQKKMPELKLSVDYVKRKHSRAITSLNFSFKKAEKKSHDYTQSAPASTDTDDIIADIYSQVFQQPEPVPAPHVSRVIDIKPEPTQEELAAIAAAKKAKEEALERGRKAGAEAMADLRKSDW